VAVVQLVPKVDTGDRDGCPVVTVMVGGCDDSAVVVGEKVVGCEDAVGDNDDDEGCEDDDGCEDVVGCDVLVLLLLVLESM